VWFAICQELLPDILWCLPEGDLGVAPWRGDPASRSYPGLETASHRSRQVTAVRLGLFSAVTRIMHGVRVVRLRHRVAPLWCNRYIRVGVGIHISLRRYNRGRHPARLCAEGHH